MIGTPKQENRGTETRKSGHRHKKIGTPTQENRNTETDDRYTETRKSGHRNW